MLGSTLNQRFRLERVVRLGRSGTAYLATDAASGELLIVKLFSKEIAPDSDASLRFRNALNRLQGFEHPQVAAPHALGIANGQCYQAASYFPAESLETELQEKSLPLQEAIDLLGQIVLGLDELHRAGIVHGGLLPRRILVSRAEALRAVLIDPARHLLPPVSAGRGGDLAYSAPEQFPWLEQATDPRTDLYAVGMLACRLFLGAVPFGAEAEANGSRVHWMGTAARSLRTAASLPPEWRTILLRLVAVAPEDRYATAGHLLADLDRLGHAARRKAAGPRHPPWFQARMRPIGSTLVPDAVSAALGKAQTGHGSVLVLHGWEGTGMESILRSTIPAIESSGSLLLRARLLDADRLPPLSVLRHWIADLANQWEVQPQARGGDRSLRFRQAVTRLGGGLADLVPELAAFGLDARASRAEPTWSPRELKRQRASELSKACELLAALADGAQPLVLWVQDASRLDADSAEWLGVLVRRLASAPLVLMIGAPPTADGDRAGSDSSDGAGSLIQSLLRGAGSEEQVAWVSLLPLTPAETKRQVDWLLNSGAAGDGPDRQAEQAVAERLYANWRGVPWAQEQMLRLMIDEGVLLREPAGEETTDQSRWTVRESAAKWVAPNTVRDLIERRIDAMPDELRLPLEAAAVLPEPFTPDALANLLDGFPKELLVERLDACVAAGWLGLGLSGYGFVEPLAQRWVYQLLERSRRQHFHLSAGTFEGSHSGETATAQVWTAAAHLAQAGDPSRVTAHLLHVAGSGSWPLCIGSAADLPAPPSAAAGDLAGEEIELRRAQADLALGKPEAALARLESDGGSTPEHRSIALLLRAHALAERDRPEAMRLVETALELAGHPLPRRGLGTFLARVTFSIAQQYGGRGPHDERSLPLPRPDQRLQFALLESAAQLAQDLDPTYAASINACIVKLAGQCAASRFKVRALIRLGALDGHPESPRFPDAFRLLQDEQLEQELAGYHLGKGLAALNQFELQHAGAMLERASAGFAGECDPTGQAEAALARFELARLQGPQAALALRAAELIECAGRAGSAEQEWLGRGAQAYAGALGGDAKAAGAALAELVESAGHAARRGSRATALRLATWSLDLALQSRHPQAAIPLEPFATCLEDADVAGDAGHLLAAWAEWHLDPAIDSPAEDSSHERRARALLTRIAAEVHASRGLALRARIAQAMIEFRHGRPEAAVRMLAETCALAEQGAASLMLGHAWLRAAEGLRGLALPNWMAWAGKALTQYDALGAGWLTAQVRTWLDPSAPGGEETNRDDASALPARLASFAGLAGRSDEISSDPAAGDEPEGAWPLLERVIREGPLDALQIEETVLRVFLQATGAERAALFFADAEGKPVLARQVPAALDANWINLWLVQSVADEGRIRMARDTPVQPSPPGDGAAQPAGSMMAVPVPSASGAPAVVVLASGEGRGWFHAHDGAQAELLARRAGTLLAANARLAREQEGIQPAPLAQAAPDDAEPVARSIPAATRGKPETGLLSGHIRGLSRLAPAAPGGWSPALRAYYERLESCLDMYRAILTRRSETGWSAVCPAGPASAILAAQAAHAELARPPGDALPEAGLDPYALRTGIALHVATAIHRPAGAGPEEIAVPDAASVRLAERLAELGAFLRLGPILTSELTGSIPAQSMVALRPLGPWRLMPGAEPRELVECIRCADAAQREFFLTALGAWRKALDGYRRGDWATASIGFSAYLRHSPTDRMARLMLRRCRRRGATRAAARQATL